MILFALVDKFESINIIANLYKCDKFVPNGNETNKFFNISQSAPTSNSDVVVINLDKSTYSIKCNNYELYSLFEHNYIIFSSN